MLLGCREKLTVTEFGSYTYATSSGLRISVFYYKLSDSSLEFVKLVLPDGTKCTLPHLLSASGVKYSDDFQYIWWTKGETAFLEKRDEYGEWQIIYQDCHKKSRTERNQESI